MGGCVSRASGECAICLQPMRSRFRNRKRLVCKHFFHYQCIANWLELNRSCPICRQVIPLINNQQISKEVEAILREYRGVPARLVTPAEQKAAESRVMIAAGALIRCT